MVIPCFPDVSARSINPIGRGAIGGPFAKSGRQWQFGTRRLQIYVRGKQRYILLLDGCSVSRDTLHGSKSACKNGCCLCETCCLQLISYPRRLYSRRCGWGVQSRLSVCLSVCQRPCKRKMAWAINTILGTHYTYTLYWLLGMHWPRGQGHTVTKTVTVAQSLVTRAATAVCCCCRRGSACQYDCLGGIYIRIVLRCGLEMAALGYI